VSQIGSLTNWLFEGPAVGAVADFPWQLLDAGQPPLAHIDATALGFMELVADLLPASEPPAAQPSLPEPGEPEKRPKWGAIIGVPVWVAIGADPAQPSSAVTAGFREQLSSEEPCAAVAAGSGFVAVAGADLPVRVQEIPAERLAWPPEVLASLTQQAARMGQESVAFALTLTNALAPDSSVQTVEAVSSAEWPSGAHTRSQPAAAELPLERQTAAPQTATDSRSASASAQGARMPAPAEKANGAWPQARDAAEQAPAPRRPSVGFSGGPEPEADKAQVRGTVLAVERLTRAEPKSELRRSQTPEVPPLLQQPGGLKFQTPGIEQAAEPRKPELAGEANALKEQPGRADISVLLEPRQASGKGPVAVRLVERAGRIEVMVRSRDENLAQALREQLPSLIEGLERRGFDARVWLPVPTDRPGSSGQVGQYGPPMASEQQDWANQHPDHGRRQGEQRSGSEERNQRGGGSPGLSFRRIHDALIS